MEMDDNYWEPDSMEMYWEEMPVVEVDDVDYEDDDDYVDPFFDDYDDFWLETDVDF